MSNLFAPSNHRSLWFMARMLAIFLAWYFGYQFWLEPDGRLDAWLTQLAADGSLKAMQLLGYNGAHLVKWGLHLGARPLVYIGPSCNALMLYAIYTSFIVAAPGSWRIKLLFVPLGVLAIYLINIVRIVALALIALHLNIKEVFDLNHHFVFYVVVYGFIFWLWTYWINRFSGIGQTEHQ